MTTINMMTTKEIDRRSEEPGDQRTEDSVAQSKHKTTRWQRRCRMAASFDRILEELGDQQIEASIAQSKHETAQRDRATMEEKMDGD